MTTLTNRSPGEQATRRDRGQASIEFVGLIPLVMIALVGMLQVMVLAYTVHGASQAARDAARAYSLNESPQAAAQASLPGAVRLVSVSTYGPDHGVRVTVEAPTLLLVTDRLVTRSVTMP